MNLQQKIGQLQSTTCELLHLVSGTGYLYVDEYARLNREISVQLNTLCREKRETMEQEANLCLAVLMGYCVTMYANPSDERRKQSILQRSYRVLKQLPSSLLKCELLAYCYNETGEEELAQEAQQILESLRKHNYIGEIEEKEILEIMSISSRV